MEDNHARPLRTWLILGDKAGDNAQAETIVNGLGWPYERKTLRFKNGFARPIFRPTLRYVDLGKSASLQPPWPDVIITAGRRPSCAALWVKEQSLQRAKILLIGRPHRLLQRFDLIVAPGQFHLPDAPNILRTVLPLIQVSETAVEQAVGLWGSRLGHLARPLTAVFIGGPQPPFRFDAETAEKIIRQVVRTTPSGTIIVLTSRRTTPAITQAIKRTLPISAPLFSWTSDPAANPYLAMLGLAKRFVVSGDSISMLAEVAWLGKPLAIAALPLSRNPLIRLEQEIGSRFRAAAIDGSGMWSLMKRQIYRYGFAPLARDIPSLHSMIIEAGLARMLGDPICNAGSGPTDNMAETFTRIRQMLLSS